jgi:hypothetical protein
MAKSVVTLERFSRGMTFDEYVKYTGSPENLAREAFGESPVGSVHHRARDIPFILQ